MKILLITTRYRPEVGGVEQVVEHLANEFSNDHKVEVITSMPKGANPFQIEEPIEIVANYSVKRIWINSASSFIGYFALPYRILAGAAKLRNEIVKFNPDIVNFHFPDHSSIYLWLALLNLKFRLVVNIHGNDLHVFSKKSYLKPFIAGLLDRSSRIIVNSSYMHEEFDQLFPSLGNKVIVIPNGINIELIRKAKTKRYFETLYIFYLGRLVHKKGVDVLLKAFAKANLENLFLLIVGSGEEFANLKSLTNDLGIPDKVRFTNGSLSDDEKFSYMKGAMFGVMPSRIEPFGIVALEFLAAGVPLIASKTGGLKDVLNSKTTLYFEKENVDDLAQKMLQMYEDRKLRKTLVENGLARTAEYTWSLVATKYLELYSKQQNYENIRR